MSEKEPLRHWQCKICGKSSPITAYECTNPNCRADLNLYGDVVLDEEPPTPPKPDDPVIQDDDSQGKREKNHGKRFKENQEQEENIEEREQEEERIRQQILKEMREKRRRVRRRILSVFVLAAAALFCIFIGYKRPWEKLPVLQEQPSTAINSELPGTEATETMTQIPTTEAVETEASMTEEPTTKVPETEELTTEVPTTEEKTTEEEQEVTTEPRDEETAEDIDGTGFLIGMVTDISGINDGSFNQSAWEGLQRAREDFGCEISYVESKVESDYEMNIEVLLDEEYDLIIVAGYTMADTLYDVAGMFPDQKFVIIDDSSNSDLDNVTCLMFEQAQASYLAGLAAGMTTETDNVGFVLGRSTAAMNEFGYGYLAGVLDANPDAAIQQYNVNSFGDSATAMLATNNMISKGADIVFHAAGDSGLGVIEACRENGIWAIGVDSDQSSLGSGTVLTSAVKRVDNACYDTVRKVIKDELQSGIVVYDLSMGGVDIAPTTDNLSDEVLKAVEDAKQDIIDGRVVVPKTQKEFEAKYGNVYELDD